MARYGKRKNFSEEYKSEHFVGLDHQAKERIHGEGSRERIRGPLRHSEPIPALLGRQKRDEEGVIVFWDEGCRSSSDSVGSVIGEIHRGVVVKDFSSGRSSTESLLVFCDSSAG
jgi:hypothetical protein